MQLNILQLSFEGVSALSHIVVAHTRTYTRTCTYIRTRTQSWCWVDDRRTIQLKPNRIHLAPVSAQPYWRTFGVCEKYLLRTRHITNSAACTFAGHARVQNAAAATEATTAREQRIDKCVRAPNKFAVCAQCKRPEDASSGAGDGARGCRGAFYSDAPSECHR